MKHKFDILISATDKGVKQTMRRSTRALQEGFGKARLAVKAFNTSVTGGQRAMAGISGQIKALVGAYAGLSAIGGATRVMKDADQALFNLKSSVTAATREFENIGSVQSWEKAINRLSGELKIYSDTALRQAVSRTVDMTKRLGLSQSQMEEVIRRSADLGAGKVELTESVERVTAALRGEAESAEYLGLTLNEDYIKSWYQANVQTERAWKDLTDLEKAQVRYTVMLEQSHELQGRAAQSAQTFGGALQLIRKEAENAIINNKAAVAAMNDLAQALRENAGDVGEMASGIISFTAGVMAFALKYKEMLMAIAGTAAAVVVVKKFMAVIQGLNAAFTVLAGGSFLTYARHVQLSTVHTNIFKVAVASLGNAMVVAAASMASFYAGWKIGELINDLRIFKDMSATVGDAVQYTYGNIDKFFTRIRINQMEFTKALPPLLRQYKTWGRFDAKESDRKIKAAKQHLAAIEIGQRRLEQKAVGKPSQKSSKDQSDGKAEADEIKARIEQETKSVMAALNQRINAGKKAAAGVMSDHTQREIERMKTLNQTALAELQSLHERGKVKMEQYFTQRRDLIQGAHDKEIALLNKKAGQSEDPKDRLVVEDRIFQKEQAHKRKLIQLADEQRRAEKQFAEEKARLLEAQERREQKAIKGKLATDRLMTDLRSRAGRDDAGTALESDFTMELAEIDARHAKELARLEALNAKKAEIDEAYRLQKQERDRLLIDQERRLDQQRLENTRTIAGGMADIFKNLYELTGKKSKEFFYLSKAAALAEAIINTAQGVTKALAQGGMMGPAMAAVVSASGAVQIATIAAQKLATGGTVLGSSPTPTADNIPIMATAGEFMQPVSTVKYYGGEVMEALRRKIIPKELFSGIALPGLKPNYGHALASGGQVSRSSDSRQNIIELSITNFVDPNLFDQYVNSTTGQKSLFNMLSQNSFQTKQIIKG